MFSKQYNDLVAHWLWVWLTQLMGSWLSSPPTQSAQLDYATFQLLSTNSARICWAATPVTQQELLSLTPPPVARNPSINSARVCWAAAPEPPSTNSKRICWSATTMTQQTALSQTPSRYVCNRGTQYYGDWVSSTSSAWICWAYPGHLCTTTRLSKKKTESGSPLHTAQRLSRRK